MDKELYSIAVSPDPNFSSNTRKELNRTGSSRSISRFIQEYLHYKSAARPGVVINFSGYIALLRQQ